MFSTAKPSITLPFLHEVLYRFLNASDECVNTHGVQRMPYYPGLALGSPQLCAVCVRICITGWHHPCVYVLQQPVGSCLWQPCCWEPPSPGRLRVPLLRAKAGRRTWETLGPVPTLQVPLAYCAAGEGHCALLHISFPISKIRRLTSMSN